MAVKGLLVLCGFLALAAVRSAPVLAHFGTRLGSQGGDALLITWILAWDVHALTTNPFGLFDANLAYPLERSLAFSDHLLGVLPLFAPVDLLTGNPVAGFNTVLVLSGALAAFGAFALAWWCTGRWWPAIVAGTLFGFAPLRLSQLGHLQLLTFFWAPWALLFLDRFLRARRWLDLAVFAVFSWLQVLSSFYLGVMLTVAVVLYTGAYALTVDRSLLGRAMVTRAVALATASLAVLLPVHWPYLEVHRAWEAAWTPGSMVGYSADLQSYLSAPALVNDLYVSVFRPVTPAGAHERLLFPGLILPALVLLGTLARVRGVAEAEVRRLRRLFGLVAVVAFILSLGPYLVVWGVNTHVPLPYLILYYVVPGWSGMRVPARFAFLVLLALVPLSALGVQAVVERVAAFRAGATWGRLAPPAVAFALVLLFLVELGAKPLPLQAVPTGAAVPEVYRWLARERPGPVVEIPLDLQGRDQEFLYLSTVHWLPLVNARSGFGPSSHDEVKTVLAELPGPRGREYAAALGLRALVVHTDRLTRAELTRWAVAEQARHVRRLAVLGPDVVYTVEPIALAASLGLRAEAPDTLTVGADVRLGLRLAGVDGRPWAQGSPHRIARATVSWTDLGTGKASTTTVPVALPLVVAGGESVAIPLRVTAPGTRGSYALDVALDSPVITAPRRTIEVRDAARLPTSAETGDRLGARYLVEGGTAPRALPLGDTLHVRLVAINTGEAVWLAKSRGKKGEVALAWRWLDATGRPADQEGGQARIRYDVHPGQSYGFDVWLAGPVDPGRYELEVGLVTGGIGPFAADAPVSVGVDVGRAVTAAARP